MGDQWICPDCNEVNGVTEAKCSCGFELASNSDEKYWTCPNCGTTINDFFSKCDCGYVRKIEDGELKRRREKKRLDFESRKAEQNILLEKQKQQRLDELNRQKEENKKYLQKRFDELKQLRDEGIITEDEYNKGRQPILDKFLDINEKIFHEIIKEEIELSQSVPTTNGEGIESKIVKATRSAVATVFATNSQGSGFCISRKGMIVTNAHVIGSNKMVKVVFLDGEEIMAEVYRIDREKDIAIISTLKGEFPFVIMGDSDTCQQADKVIAIGSPIGYQSTVTTGIISAIRKNRELTYIQTDTAINPGNSGGPLLNMRGEVIGMNTSGIDKKIAEGMNFAISINDIKKFIETS